MTTRDQREAAWRQLRADLAAGPLMAELVAPVWQYGLFDNIVVDPPIGGGQYQYGPTYVRWSEPRRVIGWDLGA